MSREIENLIIRYLESLGVKIWYGAGRPFTKIVLYVDDDEQFRCRELWLEPFADFLATELARK